MILHASIPAANPALVGTVLVVPASWAGVLVAGRVRQSEHGVRL